MVSPGAADIKMICPGQPGSTRVQFVVSTRQAGGQGVATGILAYVSCSLKPWFVVTDLHFLFFVLTAQEICFGIGIEVYPEPREPRMLQVQICVDRLYHISANVGIFSCREGPKSRPEALRQPGTAIPIRYPKLCAWSL